MPIPALQMQMMMTVSAGLKAVVMEVEVGVMAMLALLVGLSLAEGLFTKMPCRSHKPYVIRLMACNRRC